MLQMLRLNYAYLS